MSSETEVANLAAARIGTETRILSLDDDRTIARTLKAVWAIERRATLRDGSFNFATTREALPALSGTVPYPYSKAYQLPATCLRLLEVLNSPGRDSYQLEGGKILCDAGAPLYIRFITDVPEAALWDDAFAEAFASRLAWKCGRRIAGSDFDTQGAWSEYQTAIGRAKSVDAKENPPLDQEESSWVTARFGGRSYDPTKWG